MSAAVTVAAATAAAPTYYAPMDDGRYKLIDGGVWANNPIMVALVDVLSCFDVPRCPHPHTQLGMWEPTVYRRKDQGSRRWRVRVVRHHVRSDAPAIAQRDWTSGLADRQRPDHSRGRPSQRAQDRPGRLVSRSCCVAAGCRDVAGETRITSNIRVSPESPRCLPTSACHRVIYVPSSRSTCDDGPSRRHRAPMVAVR